MALPLRIPAGTAPISEFSINTTVSVLTGHRDLFRWPFAGQNGAWRGDETTHPSSFEEAPNSLQIIASVLPEPTAMI